MREQRENKSPARIVILTRAVGPRRNNAESVRPSAAHSCISLDRSRDCPSQFLPFLFRRLSTFYSAALLKSITFRNKNGIRSVNILINSLHAFDLLILASDFAARTPFLSVSLSLFSPRRTGQNGRHLISEVFYVSLRTALRAAWSARQMRIPKSGRRRTAKERRERNIQ